ncbi:MAG: hypothetical protein ACJAXM_001440 [Arenicella sp.]|jgi:hypothetical protein
MIDDDDIDLELLALIVSDLPNIDVLKRENNSDAVDFLSSKSKVSIDWMLCDYEIPRY